MWGRDVHGGATAPLPHSQRHGGSGAVAVDFLQNRRGAVVVDCFTKSPRCGAVAVDFFEKNSKISRIFKEFQYSSPLYGENQQI